MQEMMETDRFSNLPDRYEPRTNENQPSQGRHQSKENERRNDGDSGSHDTE
jgi:hypothetical protein